MTDTLAGRAALLPDASVGSAKASRVASPDERVDQFLSV
jgi:hypothetical protein